jgi:hypothetical protein
MFVVKRLLDGHARTLSSKHVHDIYEHVTPCMNINSVHVLHLLQV